MNNLLAHIRPKKIGRHCIATDCSDTPDEIVTK